MKYYLIAGEASGDLHGAGIVNELVRRDPEAKIRAWGGDLMKEAGAEIVMHYRELAFMGFVEVLKNIRTILKNLSFCKGDILAFEPDALILIDYPGFNLRIARWAREREFPVMYYISPQVWAWNVKRVFNIKRDVNRMFTILPFESAFYAQYGVNVTYVGHPLKKVIDQYRKAHPAKRDDKLIALLPGSRKQEISKMLPVFLEVAASFPGYRFEIGRAPSTAISFYEALLPQGLHNVGINGGDTYGLLNRAHAAITTSGTATLETALFRVPQVVCYKGNPVSYQFARRLVRVPFISLVNLIAEKEVVSELIQADMNTTSVKAELQRILDGEKRKVQLQQYGDIHQKLDHEGSPPALVVQEIIRYLGER